MRIVFIGGPGSGKSTVGNRLASDLKWPWISSGEILRESKEPWVVEKLKTALRVSDIVTVEVMEGAYRRDASFQYNLLGLLVNMRDYNVGADKGGQVSMFDDFDINYNKYEYLIETRCSGALVKPFAAISFEEKVSF